MPTGHHPTWSPLSKAVWGAICIAASTMGFYQVRTGGFEIIGPRAWIGATLIFGAFGATLLGWAVLTRGRDPRPGLIAYMGSLLFLLLFGVAWETPAAYLATLAGILASLIIAVSVASSEAFVPPAGEDETV